MSPIRFTELENERFENSYLVSRQRALVVSRCTLVSCQYIFIVLLASVNTMVKTDSIYDQLFSNVTKINKAMFWTKLPGTPLSLNSSYNNFSHFIHTIVLFYSFTAWRLLNSSLSRKKSQVYKMDKEENRNHSVF